MAKPVSTFVHFSDIYWCDIDKDWILIVKGHGFQPLCCGKSTNKDILIDQVFRNLHYKYGFNVIYSKHFYTGRFKYPTTDHYLKGFF